MGMKQPKPLIPSELTTERLRAMLRTLTTIIEDTNCAECTPPPEVFQARENILLELEHRGIVL
jgi:hypothetical protein